MIKSNTQRFPVFSYRDKKYFYTQERKSFGEANEICRNRNELMVQIKSKDEDDFIRNTILKLPKTYVWLGAANTVGTRSFKWFDGSELTYSNWAPGYPNETISQRLRIAKSRAGHWHDYDISSFPYSHGVLCEKTFFAIQSRVVEQTHQFKLKLNRLDEQISSVISRGITARDEFAKLIANADTAQRVKYGEVVNSMENNYGQCIQMVSDGKRAQQTTDSNLDKLGTKVSETNVNVKTQLNDLWFELQFFKRQSSALVIKLEDERSSNKKQHSILAKQNEWLEARLNRLEQKMSTNSIDNLNRQAI